MGRLVLRVSCHEYVRSFVWSFSITETSLALSEGYGKRNRRERRTSSGQLVARFGVRNCRGSKTLE